MKMSVHKEIYHEHRDLHRWLGGGDWASAELFRLGLKHGTAHLLSTFVGCPP
jgi:hypothetical protein